jgi:ketosteroid isomerase-like protein
VARTGLVGPEPHTDKEDDPMTADDSTQVLDAWVHAWNAHDAEAATTLVTDDHPRREPGGPQIDGPDAQRDYMKMVFSAFPDIHIEFVLLDSLGLMQQLGVVPTQ